MKINKQLFEDVLSGKLKGTFVLRNKSTLHSSNLRKIAGTKYQYVLCGNLYTSEGMLIFNNKTHPLNIEDFIPETNMKENELKITIPEGQEIDWQESAKQEKIVFKKKDPKPRSWEEYCNNFSGELFYFSNRNSIESVVTSDGMSYTAKDYLPSKELAEAFLAMMQLMSLRQAWIGDWKPDWNDETRVKWNIICLQNQVCLCDTLIKSRVLSFPTKEMAIDFMNCFRVLLEIAKPLI